MYAAGHILASLGLATLAARRRPALLAPLAAIAMAVNAIDLDHIIFHRLDDGTANSLTLHPAHVYFPLIAAGLFLAGMLDQRRLPYWMMALGGLCLHMALDALATMLNYRLAVLAAVDAALLLAVCLLFWRLPLEASRRRLISFAVTACLVCNGVQGFMHFGLGLRLDRDAVVVFVAPALSLAAGAAFWRMFRRKAF